MKTTATGAGSMDSQTAAEPPLKKKMKLEKTQSQKHSTACDQEQVRLPNHTSAASLVQICV